MHLERSIKIETKVRLKKFRIIEKLGFRRKLNFEKMEFSDKILRLK